MASETPRQRPQRREDAAEPSTGSGRARTPRGDGAAPGSAPAPRSGGLAGAKRFIEESIAELKKVDWPVQAQVIQGTGVVLFACLVVGVYLYVADQAFKHLVENVFLGQ